MSAEILSEVNTRSIHERQQKLEIEGNTIKSICSNIRRNDGLLDNAGIQPEGIGFEGDLVLVEVMASGSTMHVENQYGRDE